MKHLKILAILGTVLFMWSCQTYSGNISWNDASVYQNELRNNFLVIGHRGAAGLAPENTMAAVRAAQVSGSDAFEIDIQRTSDGKLVLLHDLTLGRTTDGSGFVGSKSWDEVKQLDAGSWFGEEFAGEPVPSLERVLRFARTSRMIPCIEVKSPDMYPGIAEELMAELRSSRMARRCYVLSFDAPFLRRMEEMDPRVKTILLSFLPVTPSTVADFDGCSVYFGSLRWSPWTVGELRDEDKLVFIWGTDNLRRHQWFLDRGIDGITCDYPNQTVSSYVRYAERNGIVGGHNRLVGFDSKDDADPGLETL